MIHDPTFEVTCDGEGCGVSSRWLIPFVGRASREFLYHHSHEWATEKVRFWGWIVKDGMHYCCRECAGEEKES